MLDKGINPYPEQEAELPKFKSWNKHVKIIFIGLLLGAAFFGTYLTVIGFMNLSESPLTVSNNVITTDYPLSAENLYYRTSLKSEVVIYNNAEWNVSSVWIGKEDEYNAYRNNKLVTSEKHLFRGPFTMQKSLQYKYTVKTYLLKEDPLNNIFENKHTIVVVADGKKKYYSVVVEGEKENMKLNINEVSGNVSSPMSIM